MEIAPQLLQGGIKVIDLSGAFRLKNVHSYEKYYKHKHLYPRLLKRAVYGLPERNRFVIKGADFVASGGCYATAVIIGLLPFFSVHSLSRKNIIMVVAVSGYTGAGREYIKKAGIPKKIRPYDWCRRHRHVPEIEQELGLKGQLQFYPSIAPWPRGIEVNILIQARVTTDIFGLYRKFYQQDQFVEVRSMDVVVEDVIGTNFCHIYPKTEGSFIKIKVAIDNLVKGAAGQAIQNMNIMCGLPEDEGL
jgi:N-acetyl-gamma-glutamyl-phosphate reductase